MSKEHGQYQEKGKSFFGMNWKHSKVTTDITLKVVLKKYHNPFTLCVFLLD